MISRMRRHYLRRLLGPHASLPMADPRLIAVHMNLAEARALMDYEGHHTDSSDIKQAYRNELNSERPQG
jgi:hypothetical protein